MNRQILTLSLAAVFLISGSAAVAAPPVLEVSPTHLEFSAYEGGPNPENQILSIWRGGGNGPLRWEITESCSWLTVEPTSGKSMGEVDDVNVIVDISGLAAGTYNCELIVDAGTAVNSPQTVGVTLTIGAEGIWVTPNSFDVNIIEGTVLTKTLTIGNNSNEDLDFMIRTRQVGNSGAIVSIDGISAGAIGSGVFSIPENHDFTVVGDANYVPGRLIVRFAAGADGKIQSVAEKNQILSSLGGGTVKRNYKIVPGLSVVELPAGMTVEEALKTFNKADGILYAEPDYEVRTCSTIPDDTRFDELWGMHNTGQTGGAVDADIDAPEAWDIGTGSDEIIVAVIDTGVDYIHPDLAANMWVNEAEKNGTPGVDDDGNGYVDDIYGYDFRNNDGDPMDDHYHGTHCSGTVGGIGNNGEGVAGVNWTVSIMALKFLSSGGSGWTSDAVRCVEYSTLMGANLSSNSWGGGDYSQALKDAIDAAGAAGMLFVAAAGNNSSDNDGNPHYPSSYDCQSIIAVMSTDKYDNKSGFSNWGPISVDLGAPGSDILSCQLGGGYKYASGTSMATPHVAGACALLWSMNPAMSNDEVKDILLRTGDQIPALAGKCVSEGRLNLYQAILETKAPWIHIEPEEGTVASGQSVDINVTFDAIYLEPGTYEAEIMIVSNDPCSPAIVPVTMMVSADDLQVTPAEGFESIGTEGGPFEPNCMSYTLTNNNGTESVNWATWETEDWLDVEPNGGVLDPCESIEINVCISADADLLDPNLYTHVLAFQNTDSNSIKPRFISLIVKPPDCFTESFDDSGGDLERLMVTFIPDGTIAYYEACRDRIDEFPTDPNGGTYLPLGNDDFAEVILCDDANILFYGARYDRFYIGSNGYITFGQGDTESSASLKNHFSLPRISALFTDLDPASGGVISYKQLGDRVVVTFEDVPLSGDETAKNNFQIELFFVDGTICITWLDIAATSGVAGLSKGRGLPPVFFKESNLNRYVPCWPCGDFNRNYTVNFVDFAVLASHWLDKDCDIPYWCEKTDLDFSGITDTTDLDIFSENWLAKEDWWLQPVSHWKFDEGHGDVAYDSSFYGNDGTLYGGPYWVPGKGSYALDFDGVDDYVDVPDDSSLRFTQHDSFTISYWALPISNEHGGWIVCKMQPSAQSHCFTYETNWNSSNSAFGFTISRANSTSWVPINTIAGSAPAGSWYHVTAVYENRDMKIYLNGQLNVSGNFPYDTDGTSSNNMSIGTRLIISTPESGTFFDGTIDDVRVYDRALSAEEIQQLYREGLSNKAFGPDPTDGAVSVDPNTVLSWKPGKDAVSHDVYFGTDFDDVNDATTDSNEYMGRQDANNWDPSGLEYETTYYWRIDEVNDSHTGSPWKGDVWSFTTWSKFDPNLNLTGWWEFDEGDGGIAHDSAGNNDGTIYGASWTTGQIDGALSFDGVGDYVEVPDDPSLRFIQYDSFTISYWALPISDEHGGWIVCKMQPSAQSHCFTYETNWNSSNSTFGFTISRANSSSWVPINTIAGSAPAGSWYHVTAVYDNRDMKIYLNGQLNVSGNFPYDTDGASSNNMSIGTRLIISTPESGTFFDGTIDDVRVYDRALSAEEIWQLYLNGLN